MQPVCPYCRMEVDSAVYCPTCATPHHPECWEENRGCTVFGCSDAPPDEPKINLADPVPPPLPGFPPPPLPPPPPPPPPPSPASATFTKYSAPEVFHSDRAVGARVTLADRVFGFFEHNPWAWDYALVSLWGSAAGGFAGTALGFVGGLCAMMFAGQFGAIFTFPAKGLVFGQSLALVAGFLAVLFGGNKFTAFLRGFSQTCLRAINPPREAEDSDEFTPGA